jgi:hypothetical protein
MNLFKSVLLIAPIGLMSADEQSYLVKYPRRLSLEYQEQEFIAFERIPTFRLHWRSLEQGVLQVCLDTKEEAGRKGMPVPYVILPEILSLLR